MAPTFPHEADYLNQVLLDLDAWMAGGFKRPDFAKSLALFNPQSERRDGIEHLWVGEVCGGDFIPWSRGSVM